MKEIKTYISDDGKTFDTAEKCLSYEKDLEAKKQAGYNIKQKFDSAKKISFAYRPDDSEAFYYSTYKAAPIIIEDFASLRFFVDSLLATKEYQSVSFEHDFYKIFDKGNACQKAFICQSDNAIEILFADTVINQLKNIAEKLEKSFENSQIF